MGKRPRDVILHSRNGNPHAFRNFTVGQFIHPMSQEYVSRSLRQFLKGPPVYSHHVFNLDTRGLIRRNGHFKAIVDRHMKCQEASFEALVPVQKKIAGDTLEIRRRPWKSGPRHAADKANKGLLNEIAGVIARAQAALEISLQPRCLGFVDLSNIGDPGTCVFLRDIVSQAFWRIEVFRRHEITVPHDVAARPRKCEEEAM